MLVRALVDSTNRTKGKITRGMIYQGQIYMTAKTMRMVVYDDTGKWTGFEPELFVPAQVEIRREETPKVDEYGHAESFISAQ